MKDLIIIDGELQIDNGDLMVDDSDLQNQLLLLLCSKGEIKQHPSTGVGIMNYLENENPTELLEEIRRQFRSDGMKVHSLGFVNGKLAIDANY